MRYLITFARTQSVALIALAVALSGVAYAASLQIGAVNTAAKSTGLTNTGAGPALKLNVKPGFPPLAVNSMQVVPKLNASQLQGKGAGAFAKTGASYTKGQSDGRYPLVLYSSALTGTITGIATPAVLLDETVTPPRPGVLVAYLVGDWEGGFGRVELKIDGVLRGEIRSDHEPNNPVKLEKLEFFDGAGGGPIAISATLFSDDPNPPTFAGHLAVLFIPD